jgi:hypothetical protein
MTPPELTRNTPVLDVLQPSIPVGFGLFWRDMKLASPGALQAKLAFSIVHKLMVMETTLIASSASGLQFTHHWGLSTGSMTSPDLLHGT